MWRCGEGATSGFLSDEEAKEIKKYYMTCSGDFFPSLFLLGISCFFLSPIGE